mgnify:CR=1 FL=1
MLKKVLTAIAIISLFTSPALSETLEVIKATTAPTIDGVDEGAWATAPVLAVAVSQIPDKIVDVNKEKQTGKYAQNWTKTKPNDTHEVKLKAMYSGDMIYFQAQWADSTMDDQHKPFKWEGDKADGEYVNGKEREDRLALQFPISGDFNSNMLAEASSVIDMWQWKAARTNAAGVIHDKHHLRSTSPLSGKFSTHYSAGGKEVYLARKNDGGESPYKSNKIDPFVYQGDVIAQYIPYVPAAADAADVQAKGAWKDGIWTVEIARKLDTGNHETDTIFDPAKPTQMAIAVFDKAGDHFHAISNEIDVLFK